MPFPRPAGALRHPTFLLSIDVTPIGLADGAEAADRLGPTASVRVRDGRLELTVGARTARLLVHPPN
jgi:hypothetical protein